MLNQFVRNTELRQMVLVSSQDAEFAFTFGTSNLKAILQVQPQQPPYWYRKAYQTHTAWQNEAERQKRELDAAQNYYGGPKSYYDSHGAGVEHGTTHKQKDFEGFEPQTHYRQQSNPEKSDSKFRNSHWDSQRAQINSDYGVRQAYGNRSDVAAGGGIPQPASTIQNHRSEWLSERFDRRQSLIFCLSLL